VTTRATCVPTLSSERLILEPLSFDHSAGMFSLWSEPEVCRFSGAAKDFEGRPIALPAKSPADSDRIIDFFQRQCAEGAGFRWALITQGKGRFVGTAGFNRLGPCSEYAYHLHPNFWGQGLMSEASGVAFAWLRDHHPLVEVEAFIDPDNCPSIALAMRLGFQATGQTIDGAARYLLAASSD